MQILSKILGAALTPIRTAIFWVAKLFPPLKKLANISVPARIAWLTFLFLLLTAVAFFVAGSFSENGMWEHYFNFRAITPYIIIVLMIVIPVLVYFFVRLLMVGDVSRFPDIDSAWKAGVKSLEQQGINIGETPLFLILGSPNESFATNLLRASRISLNVTEVPAGPAALHWYANQDGVYLFCTDTSCSSRLASMADSIESAAPPPMPGGNQSFDAGGTIMAGAPGVPVPGAPAAGGAGPNATMVGGPSGGAPAGGPPAGGGAGPGATIVGSPAGFPAAPPTPGGPGAPPAPPSGNAGMATMQIDPEKGIGEFIQSIDQAVVSNKPTLTPKDVNLLNARLEHVCRLIKKARQPVCPINGILSLVPFRLVERAPEQVQTASQRDLAVLRDELKLRCPLIVLVTEMDREAGFRELVRRVGVDRAKENRFGKGFNVWNSPTDEQLEAVARHACGAFEDWTYMLFKEHEGLRKPGNTKLFGLLCKIRGSFTDSLANVLADGYGYKPDRDPELANSQFMFGGCYFAATGDVEDRQAFVRSVMLRLSQQEGELSWTDEAIREDDRFQLAANLFTLLGIGSLLGLIGMIGYPYLPEKLQFLGKFKGDE